MTKLLLSLIILTSILFTNNHLYAQIPDIERAALIAFYNSTDGDIWANDSWKAEPLEEDGFSLRGTECNWVGMACNSENTAITGILIGQAK